MSEPAVSLVIPGRNCAATIGPCLDAVVPILERPDSALREILFVDDGSTDGTAGIVAGYPVTCVKGPQRGPGGARNLGWQTATSPLIWFVDSDCVSEPEALDRLLPHLDDPAVAAVSGSYGNMAPGSLLACLIHEEIVERHRRMPADVDFLATFNVVYRRAVLEALGGFDERFLKAQDAELAFRALEANHRLRFEMRSRVGHFHETRWSAYLRTQRHQGYWRVWLHHAHRGHSVGNSYSSLLDHAQPALSMLTLAALPLPLLPFGAWILAGIAGLTALMPIPMTLRLLRRLRRPRSLAFWWMSFLRGFWRGVGLTHGVIDVARSPCRTSPPPAGIPSATEGPDSSPGS